MHDDQNGFLMPYDSTEKLWADRIADLRSNPVELARLARGARAFAIERLGMRRFEEVLATLKNKPKTLEDYSLQHHYYNLLQWECEEVSEID